MVREVTSFACVDDVNDGVGVDPSHAAETDGRRDGTRDERLDADRPWLAR
jgi:hypothetical protein